MFVNNKQRYSIIDNDGINKEMLITYSRVEQLNSNDKIYFKVISGDTIKLFFSNDKTSHTNITITKIM